MTLKAISPRLLAFSISPLKSAYDIMQFVGKMDTQKVLSVPLYGSREDSVRRAPGGEK